jgi:hypothetical protein
VENAWKIIVPILQQYPDIIKTFKVINKPCYDISDEKTDNRRTQCKLRLKHGAQITIFIFRETLIEQDIIQLTNIAVNITAAFKEAGISYSKLLPESDWIFGEQEYVTLRKARDGKYVPFWETDKVAKLKKELTDDPLTLAFQEALSKLSFSLQRNISGST